MYNVLNVVYIDDSKHVTFYVFSDISNSALHVWAMKSSTVYIERMQSVRFNTVVL